MFPLFEESYSSGFIFHKQNFTNSIFLDAITSVTFLKCFSRSISFYLNFLSNSKSLSTEFKRVNVLETKGSSQQ